MYVSHDHPDHFFGAAAFDAPVYALAATRDAIAAAGEQMLANNRAAVGDFVPASIVVPDRVIEPGIEVIDGVRVEFREVDNTEAATLLIIVVPEERLILAQDLVYNNLHLFIAEGHLDEWAAQIDALRTEDFTIVLPGHGAPGGPELFDFVTDYLAVAKPALTAATTPEGLNTALMTAFPNAGGVGLLHVQNRYIFPAA